MGDSILQYVDPLQYDPRDVDELVSAALCDPNYECKGWDAVVALHWRGTEEVLKRATGLCYSPCSVERKVGADILGHLGIPPSFPRHCLGILLKMLRQERESEVLYSILIALGHLGEPDAIGPASQFRIHHDSDVRYGVVQALMGHDDPAAIQSLIELTNDEEARVRDWATFALGTQVDSDTPSLRAALIQRLSDADDDTRGGALIGLARRNDRRVITALIDELESDRVGTLAIEAAEFMADPVLYPALVDLQDWWDVDQGLLGSAVRACSQHTDPA